MRLLRRILAVLIMAARRPPRSASRARAARRRSTAVGDRSSCPTSAGHDDLDRRRGASSAGASPACSMIDRSRFHDPRSDPLSAVAEGDVVVMCHPDRHAPLVEAIGRRRRLGRDRRRRLRRRPGSARRSVRSFESSGATRWSWEPRCPPACRACWPVTSPVSWRASTRSTSPSTARPVRRVPAATTGRCRDDRWHGTTATGSTTSAAAVASCAGFPSRSARIGLLPRRHRRPAAAARRVSRRHPDQRPPLGPSPRPLHRPAADAQPTSPRGRRRRAAGRAAWREPDGRHGVPDRRRRRAGRHGGGGDRGGVRHARRQDGRLPHGLVVAGDAGLADARGARSACRPSASACRSSPASRNAVLRDRTAGLGRCAGRARRRAWR